MAQESPQFNIEEETLSHSRSSQCCCSQLGVGRRWNKQSDGLFYRVSQLWTLRLLSKPVLSVSAVQTLYTSKRSLVNWGRGHHGRGGDNRRTQVCVLEKFLQMALILILLFIINISDKKLFAGCRL